MAYDREKEATVVIDRKYHTMLSEIAGVEGRKLKKALELTIEDKYKSLSTNTIKTS